MEDKTRIIKDTKEVITLLTDTSELEMELADFNSELDIVNGLVEKLVQENQRKVQDQDEYQKKYNVLVERYEAAKAGIEKTSTKIMEKQSKAISLNTFVNQLKESDSSLIEWNDDVWMLMVEEATVHQDKTITFHFKCGVSMRV